MMQLLMMFVMFLSLSASISCVLDPICTVTGPTIVDFNGSVNSVQDRCQYTLLQVTSDTNLSVSGNFRERRRKDVSFLDRVTLTLNSSNIHLEQGGRVLVSYLQPQSCVSVDFSSSGVSALICLLSDVRSSCFNPAGLWLFL